MNLVNQTIELPATYSVSPEAAGARAAMVKRSQTVTAITTAEEQSQAVAIGSDLQTHIKSVQEMRKTLTAPFDHAKKTLIQLETDHLAPLMVEKDRLGRLVTDFQRAENERVAKEEAARQAEYQRLERERQEALAKAERARKEESQLKHELTAHNAEQAQESLIREVLPTVAKAQGAATKQYLKHRVLDAKQVYSTHAHLCEVEVKASAVNSTCVAKEGATELNPDRDTVPGLALWWESKTDFRRMR